MRTHLAKSFRTAGCSLLLLASAAVLQVRAQGQAATQAALQTPPRIALVELFTSEGCSSCPPADALLREVNEQRTEGTLVIALSEHVSYWNSLGWTDPFSSDFYTQRQSDYSARFRTEGPYTPQMVVNGREQFVGSDRNALQAALLKESGTARIALHIDSATVKAGQITFRYSAEGVTAKHPLQIMAALVDDSDHSSVRRGENAGRSLDHVFVARALAPVGILEGDAHNEVTLPLPPSFGRSSQPHHLVIFAQQQDLGPVLGVDAKAL